MQWLGLFPLTCTALLPWIELGRNNLASQAKALRQTSVRKAKPNSKNLVVRRRCHRQMGHVTRVFPIEPKKSSASTISPVIHVGYTAYKKTPHCPHRLPQAVAPKHHQNQREQGR